MKQKRITAIYISLMLICVLVLTSIVLLKRGEETVGGQSGAESPAPTISYPSLSVPEEESSMPPEEESSTPEETSDDTPKEQSVHFLACPDNIIHPSVYYDALIRAANAKGETPVFNKLAEADYDFASIYEHVAPAIKQADLAYVNVETLIGGSKGNISGYPTFNTPEAAGRTLCDLGFDIFNLAHNHMLDSYSDAYLINCAEFFDKLGKMTIGYYKNRSDTENIKIIEKNGIKIAFLAYTFSTNGVKLQTGAQTYIPYFEEALIDKQVALAKEQADIIIASCHWGDEDTYTPNAHQKKYADYLISKNVDIILGMHPHVIQPMEWRSRPDGGKSLLVYSLGNFVSGMQDGFNTLGGMLSLDIIKSPDGEIRVENVIFDPIVTHYEPQNRVKNDDTGYRNFKIYYLTDYTEELAARHNVPIWDKTHKPTLVGGTFTKQNLVNTVFKYISSEFLRDTF